MAKLVPLEERRPGITLNMYSAIAKAGLPRAYRDPLYDLYETRRPRPSPTELADFAQMQRERASKGLPPLNTFPKQPRPIGTKAIFEHLDQILADAQVRAPEKRSLVAAWRAQLREWQSQLATFPKRMRGLRNGNGRSNPPSRATRQRALAL